MPKLELLPAVDVRDGQAVRLVHGESGSETSYGDPLQAGVALWLLRREFRKRLAPLERKASLEPMAAE